MGKVACVCGHILSDVGMPAKHKSYCITEADFDFLHAVDATPLDIYKRSRDMWTCDNCHRVAFEDRSTLHLTWYRKDE